VRPFQQSPLHRVRRAGPARRVGGAVVSRLLLAGFVGALLIGASSVGAHAGTVIPRLPRTNAVDTTPRVVDDAVVAEAGVREFRQVGSTMYAGGAFRSVQNATRTSTYTRYNIFSFDSATGAVTSWAPVTDGSVYAMEASADGRWLYIAGDFSTFDGQSVNHVVKYDLLNRRVDTSFRFPVSTKRVSDLQLVGGRLFASGNFPGGIVAVDPVNGARTNYFDQTQAAGDESGYTTRIYRFSVNPDATKMVVIGSFTSIGGQARQQAAIINLGATASVSPWYSTRWDEDCASGLQWYTRDVDWAPDGQNFAIVTTGAGFPGTVKLCDTVSWWRAVDSGAQEPVWINYSGGDTFHSVVVTDQAVIASGHFRWLDNPSGRDFKGPGAVDRLGIGAIDPVSGRALAWNPSKSVEGGRGGFDLYFTSRGLWVGHFEKYLGKGTNGARELHEGLGLLPF
jgi:hypothetical protein